MSDTSTVQHNPVLRIHPRYWILDTGYQILDTRYWILDTRYQILDTRYQILDTRYQILYGVCQILITRCQILDTIYIYIFTVLNISDDRKKSIQNDSLQFQSPFCSEVFKRIYLFLPEGLELLHPYSYIREHVQVHLKDSLSHFSYSCTEDRNSNNIILFHFINPPWTAYIVLSDQGNKMFARKEMFIFLFRGFQYFNHALDLFQLKFQKLVNLMEIIFIPGYPSMKIFNPRIIVFKDLFIHGCPSMWIFNPRIIVFKDIFIRGCPSLRIFYQRKIVLMNILIRGYLSIGYLIFMEIFVQGHQSI